MKINFKALAGVAVICAGMMINPSSNIYATDNLRNYEYEAPETIKDTGKMINLVTYTFCKPSSSMDFIDENGYFNNIYISSNKVYWSRYDSNMNQISTKSWDLFYNINNEDNSSDEHKILTYNFSNAIYYNGELYVMYSRYTSKGLSVEDYKKENVMAMVVYNKEGQIVNSREYKTVELSNSYSVGDLNYTTSAPFYTSNCSLAVNNGVIACFYGRNIYMSHQTSALLFIDPESLQIISDHQNQSLDNEYWAKYYEPYGHNISHSLGQRIIATSDNQFLMMESGDAGTRGATRGLMLTKLYEQQDEKTGKYIIKKSTKKMAHYSEGSTGTNGYNCTYSVLGNIIELDDGYMYIGALDKNLNRAYGSGIDSSWNVFAQKYDKNFYKMNSQKDMQLLKNTSIRQTIGQRPTNENLGRLYLNGDEVDYGFKWLTNLDNTKTAILVRAVKLRDDNVAILWEEDKMNKNSYGGYYLSSSVKESHYMVIDKEGEIIVEDTILDNTLISDEEQYVYNNGKIYWTTAPGNSNRITVNVLDVDQAIEDAKNKPIEPIDPSKIQKGDLDRNGVVNSNDAAVALDIYNGRQLLDGDLEIGDMNNDGVINSNDAAMIMDTYNSVK